MLISQKKRRCLGVRCKLCGTPDLTSLASSRKWVSSAAGDRCRPPPQRLWWMEQLTHCSQPQLLHLSSHCCRARCGTIIHLAFNFFFSPKAEGWSDWSMLVVHLTPMLSCTSHLLLATIILMDPPSRCFYCARSDQQAAGVIVDSLQGH